MGCWSVSCGISNIAVTDGHECAIIPLKENRGDYGGYTPATLPIFGRYNDYGGMESIVHDDNTKLIEEHFGISIDEFIEFLVDGKHTYDRSEIKPIKAKLLANGRLDEIKKWRFMWVDKKVYDFMIVNLDKYERGSLDFGTPEMLELLGFKLVEGAEIDNYDPTRFNKLYERGDVRMYSDKRTLLSTSKSYIHRVSQTPNTPSCLEYYFELPEELQYIKNKTKYELWRLLPPKKQKSELCWIFAGDRYAYDSSTDTLEELLSRHLDAEALEEIRLKKEAAMVLYEKYFKDLELFGDKIVELINVKFNLHPMSGRFSPHVLYLTPQCGAFDEHQKILEAFTSINKSYAREYDDEDDEE